MSDEIVDLGPSDPYRKVLEQADATLPAESRMIAALERIADALEANTAQGAAIEKAIRAIGVTLGRPRK